MRHSNTHALETDTIDVQRRRLLLAAAAGGGAAALGALTWAAGAGATATLGYAHPEMVRIVAFDNHGKRLGEHKMPVVIKNAAAWQKQLSPLAYKVTRQGGTEPAFSGDYTQPAKPGIYRCICCDTALYNAATQFHSGTGWPSFYQPIADANVSEHTDTSFGMRRTEIRCKRCDAHLGHVFHDGPKPTGLRYCMDSVALHFEPASTA